MTSFKERFDEAFYGLIEAGSSLIEVKEKLGEAKKLIDKNKARHEMIKEILE